MNLGNAILDIKDELNKGGSISDSQIFAKIVDALGMLEALVDWEYMDRFVQFTIDLESENPRVLPMPPRLRSIEFLRIVLNSSAYKHLRERSPKDFTKLETGEPSYYWKDGMQYIWLDTIPDEAYSGELSYKQFTSLDSGDLTAEPWPFSVMWPLIKYKTLILFGPYIRDQNLMRMYGELYQLALKTYVDMNTELVLQNQTYAMEYYNGSFS